MSTLAASQCRQSALCSIDTCHYFVSPQATRSLSCNPEVPKHFAAFGREVRLVTIFRSRDISKHA